VSLHRVAPSTLTVVAEAVVGAAAAGPGCCCRLGCYSFEPAANCGPMGSISHG